MSTTQENITSLSLSGRTRVYLIVGDPVVQVKSPASVTAGLQRRGLDALVAAAQVSAANLDAFLDGIRHQQNLDGLIITVPHKFAVLPRCTDIDARARIAGCVNVMRRHPSCAGWLGANTDGIGFCDGLLAHGFTIDGKRALLVGAGGAGSAIAYELLYRGVEALAIHDTDLSRRDRLIAALSGHFANRVEAGSDNPESCDLIANATPIGMRAGDPAPIDTGALTASQFVGDVTTPPGESALIAAARARGCACMPGSGMFEAQVDPIVAFLAGTPA